VQSACRHEANLRRIPLSALVPPAAGTLGGIKNGGTDRMRRIERMQRIRSAWREGTSMLTQKALGVVAESLKRRYQRSAESAQSAQSASPFVLDARPTPRVELLKSAAA